MIKETEMDTAEVKHDEEEAQKDYEELMSDTATKESEKAEKTTALEELKENHRTNSEEIDILETKLDDLHKTCDSPIEHYAGKKEERVKEVEGIKSAKGVLQGMKI